jgi:hypothetical protein
MTIEKRAASFFRVVCNRCQRDHKLGTEMDVVKFVDACERNGVVLDERTALSILALLAGYVSLASPDVHQCEPCRREVGRGAA